MSDALAPELRRSDGAEGLTVSLDGKMLVLRFPEPQRMASWAILGGGLRRASTVAWLEVTDGELRPPVDPGELLARRLASARIGDAVGLLTSRRLDSYTDVTARYGGCVARCIATVGLGNALRAGDLPGSSGRIGTINLVCHISAALGDEGLLEALALAAEARTLAVREANLPSQRSGEPASGTGTDCIVIASPASGPILRYAGKHTALGHVIGLAVAQATRQGVARWLEEISR